MEAEIWKDIIRYEWHYQVSSLGNVRSIKGGRLLDLVKCKRNNGYLRVSLIRDWVLKTPNVHRLVAEAFLWLDRDNIKILVCHKDDVKSNNRVDNLFLWSSKDNIMDMINKWRRNPAYTISKRRSVLQTSMIWDFIREWEYMRKASQELRIQYWDICSCCKWRKKSAWWFIWKYKNPLNE